MIERLVVDQIPYIPELNFGQTGSGEERYCLGFVQVPILVRVAGKDQVVSGSIASRHYVQVVVVVVVVDINVDRRDQDQNGDGDSMHLIITKITDDSV